MRLFLILAICLLPTQLDAQYWAPSADSDYHNSIVEVIGNGYKGSGTVVGFVKDSEQNPDYYVGIIITASHVIYSQDTPMTIKFLNGCITDGGRVIKKNDYSMDGFNDIAIIRALIPDSVVPMELADTAPQCGEQVELAGYGAEQFRHWVATYGGTVYEKDGILVFSWAIQGDSGGPIICDGKVIGVICYGTGLKKYNDTPRLVVGPVYGSNTKRMKDAIKKYIQDATT